MERGNFLKLLVFDESVSTSEKPRLLHLTSPSASHCGVPATSSSLDWSGSSTDLCRVTRQTQTPPPASPHHHPLPAVASMQCVRTHTNSLQSNTPYQENRDEFKNCR